MVASRARRSRGRWLASGAAASVLTLAALATPAPVSPAPSAQAASPSWQSKHTEEFSGSALPSGCEAYTGKYAGGKSAWSSKNVDVKGGLLTLSLEKRTVDKRPYASGGIGCWGWPQKYGKYEVRARIPQGKGIDSYLGLWPVKGGEGAWTGVELLAPGTETAYITNGYGKKAETARVAGIYSDDFHTYLIEWAPKYLRITMDGDELFFSTRSYTGSRWFGLVMSSGDALTGVPPAGAKLPARFEIDRVKLFSYTGVPPTLRSETTADTSRVNGVPTPVQTLAPTSSAKAPAGSTPVSSTDATATPDTPVLAGGIWPWLLGGSLIAGAAVALLSYPRHRGRPGGPSTPQRARPTTGAGRR
jgi:beta-glucanase (GH16 family)